ncbi:preprotein translocase subunit SecG [Thioalkalicoccus limnaeus]
MQTILTVFHVLLSIGIVVLILLQHGKGADAGAAFGGGASSTVFGSRGAGNFLSRTTAILATLFFMTSIGLAYYATQATRPASLLDRPAAEIPVPREERVPTEQVAPLVPVPMQEVETGQVDDVPVPTDR